ncbi:hypothetical protein MAR_012575, partial [Mya arenaria]
FKVQALDKKSVSSVRKCTENSSYSTINREFIKAGDFFLGKMRLNCNCHPTHTPERQHLPWCLGLEVCTVSAISDVSVEDVLYQQWKPLTEKNID